MASETAPIEICVTRPSARESAGMVNSTAKIRKQGTKKSEVAKIEDDRLTSSFTYRLPEGS